MAIRNNTGKCSRCCSNVFDLCTEKDDTGMYYWHQHVCHNCGMIVSSEINYFVNYKAEWEDRVSPVKGVIIPAPSDDDEDTVIISEGERRMLLREGSQTQDYCSRLNLREECDNLYEEDEYAF